MSRFTTPGTPADPVPRLASTVVLLRPGPVVPEVFLLRRHGKSAFLGGAFVFPGGRVDEADADDRLWHRNAPTNRWAPAPGQELTESQARATFVAAVRETFEESAVLLARARGEASLCRFEDPAHRTRVYRLRSALNEGHLTFSELVADEGWELALDRLVPFAHWITPSAERRRFDTRFFLAAMPAGQAAESDNRETTEGLWATARAALEKHHRLEVFLAPPTQRILEEIAEYSTVEAALDAAKTRPLTPILPKLVMEDEQIVIHLPWSERYADLPGDGASVAPSAPDREWPAAIAVARAQDMPSGSPEPPPEALEVLRFWFGAAVDGEEVSEEVSRRWFRKDPDFDEEIRTRFGALRARAVSGELEVWPETAKGALALVVLLDQLSRNMFRGSGQAFEADAKAVAVAEKAIARGQDMRVPGRLRSFFYMPFMHSEDLDQQNRCCLAFERLSEEIESAKASLQHAHQHRSVIERFGRFPHRNESLGRGSTPEEAEWLSSGNRGY